MKTVSLEQANFELSELYHRNVQFLIRFDMGFVEPSVMGGGVGAMRAPHHNFVVISPMIMKFGTGVKLDVFYTMVTKNCDVTNITSL